jgi:hypothetical protein
MEQVEPAARVAPHALAPVLIAKSLGLVPVTLGTMLFSDALPVLESVAAIADEVAPTVVLGKLSEELNEAAGAVPVPVRVAVCGDPVALSATDNVAEKLVADAGVNVMKIEQVEFAASVAPHALAPVEIAKSLGLVPVMLGTMLFSDALPVFDNVAAIADEVAPVGVLGNGSDDVNDAAGAVPVPVSAAVCGDPVALSATDNVAEKLAAEAGVKVM